MGDGENKGVIMFLGPDVSVYSYKVKEMLWEAHDLEQKSDYTGGLKFMCCTPLPQRQVVLTGGVLESNGSPVSTCF